MTVPDWFIAKLYIESLLPFKLEAGREDRNQRYKLEGYFTASDKFNQKLLILSFYLHENVYYGYSL